MHCYAATSRMHIPKAVIFDLGGVLISSPLKAIEDYEIENNIPSGYINYAMLFSLLKILITERLPHRMHGQNLKLDFSERMKRFTVAGHKIYRPLRHGKSSIA